MRRKTVVAACLLLTCTMQAQDKKPTVEPPGAKSGKQTYREHCATCHGWDGRGLGAMASALKKPPPDDYVTDVVRFGKSVVSHGSSDMPVWGPIFTVLENGNEMSVRRRIQNLCDYLASIQEKES